MSSQQERDAADRALSEALDQVGRAYGWEGVTIMLEHDYVSGAQEAS